MGSPDASELGEEVTIMLPPKKLSILIAANHTRFYKP